MSPFFPLAVICLLFLPKMALGSDLVRAMLPESDYRDALERLIDPASTVDLAEFREIYAASEDYRGCSELDTRSMVAHAQGRKMEVSTDKLRMMYRDYPLVETHVAMATLLSESGEELLEANARLHIEVARRFLDTIIATEHEVAGHRAMHVLSIGEQYILLQYLGLSPGQRAVVEVDGRRYDVWETPDGPLYLDISAFFGRFPEC